MICRKQSKLEFSYNITAYIFIGLIVFLLILSLKLRLDSFRVLRISFLTISLDLLYTFTRVTVIALIAWFLAITGGWALNRLYMLRKITMPSINFIRHISPFTWFPFAIIWFGLGEGPVAFVLFVTLIFPALIAVREIYADVPHEYLDEAKVSGANEWQLFFHIEIPLVSVSLLNLLRILWGLGWTVVIAAEMLGTAVGLGYRILDFRYLLFYEEMIVYLVLMGIVGVMVDALLQVMTNRLRKSMLR